MRLPHRLQGQKVKSQGGAGAYCGGHLAAQLVLITLMCFDVFHKSDAREKKLARRPILIMPPPRGHYAVIGVRRPSVCPSVRPSV